MRRMQIKWFAVLTISCTVLGFIFHIQQRYPFYGESYKNSAIQHQRKSTIKIVCQHFNITNSSARIEHSVAWQLFVEHTHKFIYCEVPKAGCSNWKRVILLLNKTIGGRADDLKHKYVHTTSLLRRLSDYSPEEQIQLLNNYTKVMVTRDPLMRLVSAYRDKFFHNESYYRETIEGAIKALTRKNRNSTEKVTFEEFARYIIKENPKYRDTHWRPMFQLCDPCNIQYDIVGKFETMNQDAASILQTIGAPKGMEYPSVKHFPIEARTNENMIIDHYRKLPINVLRRLLHIYRFDFSMFDYRPIKIQELYS
ncbi:carbohydrate sulfotransferase 9-like [Discoglossus pictus]